MDLVNVNVLILVGVDLLLSIARSEREECVIILKFIKCEHLI